MAESTEIHHLREEVNELRLLYRLLAEAPIPREKATSEEVASVEAQYETVTKEEFFRALDEAPVNRRHSAVQGGC